MLEELLVSAGLEPEAAGEVPTPFEFADLEAAWRSVAAAGRTANVETTAPLPRHGHTDRWRQQADRPAPARG